MDYRIVEKEASKVVGKSVQTTMQDNEQTRHIPRFWGECHRDGTIAKLGSIGTDENLLGIMMDMQPGKEEFTYMIASKADVTSPAEGFVFPCFHLGDIHLYRAGGCSHTERV